MRTRWTLHAYCLARDNVLSPLGLGAFPNLYVLLLKEGSDTKRSWTQVITMEFKSHLKPQEIKPFFLGLRHPCLDWEHGPRIVWAGERERERGKTCSNFLKTSGFVKKTGQLRGFNNCRFCQKLMSSKVYSINFRFLQNCSAQRFRQIPMSPGFFKDV